MLGVSAPKLGAGEAVPLYAACRIHKMGMFTHKTSVEKDNRYFQLLAGYAGRAKSVFSRESWCHRWV